MRVHPKELQKLLVQIDGTPEEPLISRLTLRSMKQAKYTHRKHRAFRTGKPSITAISPRPSAGIRICRFIGSSRKICAVRMNAKRIEHYEKILPEVAKHSSEMERRADEAERECDKLKKVRVHVRTSG